MKNKAKKSALKNSAISQNVKFTPVVKAGPTEDMVLQFGENEVSISAISDKVKQDFKKSANGAELKDIRIYVKPEDNRAYYVANGEVSGSVELVE